jgi:hypothetical protein
MASHESPRTTKFCDRTKDATLARPRDARLRSESYPFDADYGARRTFEFRTKRRCIGSPPPPSPRPLSLRPLAAVRGLIDACEMMVNSRKACLAAESFLELNMTIPTEPIGSIPRPQKVITAFEQYERGSLSREEFESIGSEAVRETIEKFEATGSPVITDGEQTKPSFATYPIHGLSNLNPNSICGRARSPTS